VTIFIKNHCDIAHEAMMQVRPELAEKFSNLIKFLSKYPAAASALRGKQAPEIGSAEYIRRQAHTFANARTPRAPLPPSTIPDSMVSVILETYFNIPKYQLPRVQKEHLLSMGAENLVGDLLERYIASILEPSGWIWCSGAMIKAVDFVHPPENKEGEWLLLQIKNRDNSENSSSSAIRGGTNIKKWFRTFSRKSGSNWDKFPCNKTKSQLSEDGFVEFSRHYLTSIRITSG